MTPPPCQANSKNCLFLHFPLRSSWVELAAPHLYLPPFSSVLRQLPFRSLVELDNNNLFDNTKGNFLM